MTIRQRPSRSAVPVNTILRDRLAAALDAAGIATSTPAFQPRKSAT